MTSTFGGLEIGKRAILAQQSALNTTGHNIANANTVGYTREEAVLKATNPLAYPGLQNGTAPMTIGTGVEVSELKRIRDTYLDQQFRNEQQKAGYWETKSEALSCLESVFNEPSDAGLSMVFDRFSQSLQELAKQPDSLALRTVAIANGKAVADSFQSIAGGIDQIEKGLKADLTGKVEYINSSLKEVASLNKQIAVLKASGAEPNDLLDQRDLLVDKLSKLISVQTTPGQNGIVILSLGGVALVNGMVAGTFSVDPTNGGATVDGKAVSLDGGEVKGLLDTLNDSIPSLRNQVNLLAGTVTGQMNAIQTADDARSLDDMKNGSQTKVLFFVDKDDPTKAPTSAANMIINPDLVASPSKLAAAKSTLVGDGSNAKLMGDLQFKKIAINGTETSINDFYQSVIGQLGSNVYDAQQASDTANTVAQQVDNRRLSVSGVSIDEEMTNMVRYQQAYNAAAKYVSAVNEMLDKLINGMG